MPKATRPRAYDRSNSQAPSRSRPGMSTGKKVLLTFGLLFLLLAVVELSLRLCGVVFYPQVITLPRDADRELAEVRTVPDGQVQWVVAPSTLQGTPLAINSFGMRGPEVSVDKPPGTVRILCLGDSCTFGARSTKPYPVILEELCNERLNVRVEVLNGAVPGHAAHQGVAMLERFVQFSPDIVTVYFGFNDHWRRNRALSGPKLPEPPVTDRVLILRGLRLAYLRWVARREVFREEDVVEMDETLLRLPPNHYRAMLDEFAVLARKHDFEVVFLTAPSAFNRENLRWIVEDRGWAGKAEDVVALHEHYNDISREMAQAKGAILVDLDRIFEQQDRPLLHADGIHLSPEAHALAAESLFAALGAVVEERPRKRKP